MNGVGGVASSITCQSEDDFEEFGGPKGSSGSHYVSGFGSAGQSSSSGYVSGNPPGASSSSGSAPTSSSFGSTSQQATAGGCQRVTCCLLDDGRRCHRVAGNASYSKRVQKTVYYKRLRLETDSTSPHTYICDYHKMVIQSARQRQKKDSDDDNGNEGDDVAEVDLYQLQVNTLRRYKKHYKISSRPGLNKAQLADTLMKHFKQIPIVEKEVVTYFIYTVKAERNKLDSNRPQEGAGAGAAAGGGGGGGSGGGGGGGPELMDRY